MDSVYHDSSKRGKLLSIAIVVTLLVFFLKIFQLRTLGIGEIYLIAFGCFLLTYAGLVWALGWKVNKRSLLLYLPQSALFVFSEVLFIELFFFSKFDRVYEAVLLILILGLLFVSSYASFLMANIFAVSSEKVIPLEQVAKTTSYILSLLISYFIIFSVLSSEFFFPITLLLLIVVSFAVSVAHMSHLRLPKRQLRISVTVTVLNMVICALASIFLGSKYEIIAIAPTVAMFVSVALVVGSVEKKVKWYAVIQYSIFILIAFALNFFI